MKLRATLLVAGALLGGVIAPGSGAVKRLPSKVWPRPHAGPPPSGTLHWLVLLRASALGSRSACSLTPPLLVAAARRCRRRLRGTTRHAAPSTLASPRSRRTHSVLLCLLPAAGVLLKPRSLPTPTHLPASPPLPSPCSPGAGHRLPGGGQGGAGEAGHRDWHRPGHHLLVRGRLQERQGGDHRQRPGGCWARAAPALLSAAQEPRDGGAARRARAAPAWLVPPGSQGIQSSEPAPVLPSHPSAFSRATASPPPTSPSPTPSA